MAEDDKLSAPDLYDSNMDLESSSSLGIDKTEISLSPHKNNNDAINIPTTVTNPHVQYPSYHKPPPPPPIKQKSKKSAQSMAQNNSNVDQKNNSSEQPQQYGISSLFTSAKHTLSRGAKSVSTKTSERISLEGQLRQARISLEKFVNPKVGSTEISADKVIPKWVLKGAKGIVFLTVVKGGFLLAASVGTGCVIVKRESGLWSGPSSVGVAGIAAGFLIGASKVDYIMILPNDNAVRQFTGKGQLRLGGDLQLTVGPLGREASGSVGTGDKGFSVVYSYSHAAGLYGGLGLDGKIISVRPKCNEEFYGERLSVEDILLGKLDPRNIQNDDYELLTHLLDAYCIDEMDDEKGNDVGNSTMSAMKETQIFGRDITQLECTKLKQYKSEIPNVLITLKDVMYKYEYHLMQGIFRIDAQQSKVKLIKEMINNGDLYDIDFEEVNGFIVAALIKMWFREMPQKIFENIEFETIENVETVSDAQSVMEMINEPELSYFHWALDLCIEIGKYSDLNSMSVNNMAVVISPNLYDLRKVKSVTLSTSMVHFISLCIESRVDMKYLNEANKIMDDTFSEQSSEQVNAPKKPEIPL